MYLYLASSWRNLHYTAVHAALQDAGHVVFDFRHPEPGSNGFHWSAIDPDWKAWDPVKYREALNHPVASHGFGLDYGAMQRADAGVLLLPSGRSAHLEAGYFVGAGKPLVIIIPEPQEPELMYLMADHICLSLEEALVALQKIAEIPF